MTALLVFVSVPQNKAQRLVKVILKQRLAACVNIVKNVDSYFWWEGKVDYAKEVLLTIKTRGELFTKLKKTIKKNHPYAVPEIIGLKINKIDKSYLDWLLKETRA